MMLSGIYGAALGRSYRIAQPAFRCCRTRSGYVLAATEVQSRAPGFGLTEPLASQDAYLVVLQFHALQRHELWLAGSQAFTGAVGAGQVCVIDLRQRPVAFYNDPFHTIQFYLPMDALREVGEDHGLIIADALDWPDCVYMYDPVVLSIAQCLSRQLTASYPNDQLLIDHELLALRAHMAVRYGGARREHPRHRARVSVWQQRRAMEVLRAHVAEGISLHQLAQECCLSESALVRGFIASTGLSPHRWLAKRRIELAMDLMQSTSTSLSDIALASGFGDQAHFTRVFSKSVGVSPGVWRRQRKQPPNVRWLRPEERAQA